MNKEIAERQFYALGDALRDKKIDCRLKLIDDFDIVVECGFNYPDKMFYDISEEAEKLGISEDAISVCADVTGGEVNKIMTINAGPKSYNVFSKRF